MNHPHHPGVTDISQCAIIDSAGSHSGETFPTFKPQSMLPFTPKNTRTRADLQGFRLGNQPAQLLHHWLNESTKTCIKTIWQSTVRPECRDNSPPLFTGLIHPAVLRQARTYVGDHLDWAGWKVRTDGASINGENKDAAHILGPLRHYFYSDKYASSVQRYEMKCQGWVYCFFQSRCDWSGTSQRSMRRMWRLNLAEKKQIELHTPAYIWVFSSAEKRYHTEFTRSLPLITNNKARHQQTERHAGDVISVSLELICSQRPTSRMS